MSLTAIEAVRLKSSDKSALTRELAEGDGQSKIFKLGHANVSSLEVRVSSSLKTEGTDYTVDITQGIVTFSASPAINAEIEFTYYWSIFSDAEVQYFLDEAGGDATIAAAKVLLATAADAAKVAQRQTMAGGGGLGAVTIDTSVTARELRNTAEALIDLQDKIDGNTPIDGLTEVPWTEHNYQRQLDQHFIRES